MKKIISALVLCGLIILIACEKSKTPEKKIIRPVKSMVIQSKSKGVLRSFPGKVLPSQQAELSFEVSGKITQLPVKKGDQVKKGDMLARLDTAQYQDKVNQAAAKFTLANAQYSRGKSLIKGGYISHADLDKLRSRYQVTKADLDKANRDLRDTKLFAPFAGIISNIYVEKHERVKARQKILDLHDVSELDVQIDLPENIILNVQQARKQNIDTKPVAIFDAFPNKQFALTFKEFSSQADKDTQTYAVFFTMKQPADLTVLPGMSLIVKVTLPDTQSASAYYLIPSSAVFTDSDKNPAVWIIHPTNNTVKKTKIRIHRLTGDQIQVLSGLKQGDRIVTAGVHFLQEGQEVKPL